jgi:hypothetical protein
VLAKRKQFSLEAAADSVADVFIRGMAAPGSVPDPGVSLSPRTVEGT